MHETIHLNNKYFINLETNFAKESFLVAYFPGHQNMNQSSSFCKRPFRLKLLTTVTYKLIEKLFPVQKMIATVQVKYKLVTMQPRYLVVVVAVVEYYISIRIIEKYFQSTSEKWTSPDFQLAICVLKPNGLVFEWSIYPLANFFWSSLRMVN
jgi:hypothetical protein